MTTGPFVTNARKTAFACYLAYRHADRCCARGQISSEALARVAELLNVEVAPVWDQIFPGQEPAAYSWVLERLKLLEAEHIVSPEAAAQIRAIAQPKAQATAKADWGALALLWRVHVLYQLASEVADTGALSAAGLDRLREHLHNLSLAALNREIKNAAELGTGPQTLHAVVEEARAVVRSLIEHGALPDADGQPILTSLRGLAELGSGASIGSEGSCLVCGEALTASAVVYCAACETPHHPDCWGYVGRCSMFACGSTTATPRPGVQAQPKFDLDPAPSSKPRPEPPPRASSQTTSSTIIMIAVIFGALLLASIL